MEKDDKEIKSRMERDDYLPRIVEHAVKFDEDGNIIEEKPSKK